MKLTDDEINTLVEIHIMDGNVYTVKDQCEPIFARYQQDHFKTKEEAQAFIKANADHWIEDSWITDYCNSWNGIEAIVKKMETFGFLMTMNIGRKGNARVWFCTTLNIEDFAENGTHADPPPKAIALAALKAKGVNNER